MSYSEPCWCWLEFDCTEVRENGPPGSDSLGETLIPTLIFALVIPGPEQVFKDILRPHSLVTFEILRQQPMTKGEGSWCSCQSGAYGLAQGSLLAAPWKAR